MKTKRYLVQGFLLLLCSLTAMAGSPSEGTAGTAETKRETPAHTDIGERKRNRIQARYRTRANSCERFS